MTRRRLLTNAGVDPEQALPTEAVVQLGEVRSFASAVCSEFCAKDAQHRFPTLRGRSGALLREAVHRTRLLVVLQPVPGTTQGTAGGFKHAGPRARIYLDVTVHSPTYKMVQKIKIHA